MPSQPEATDAEYDVFNDDTVLVPGDAAAAILIDPEGRYLLQLRDQKRGIFFPGKWGCFGGAVDPKDASIEATLARELEEEIGISVAPRSLRFFTHLTFDMSFCGVGTIFRTFFELALTAEQVRSLRLGEGREVRAFSAREALTRLNLVPYDEFALWMHATRHRLASGR